DVIVSRSVRFDCRKTFATAPFAHSSYTDATGKVNSTTQFTLATQQLIPVNASHLPAANQPLKIVFEAQAGAAAQVLTTDFFAFDDGTDHYGLRADDAQARAVEMGDAVLGLVCAEDLADPPPWMIVRNASDPQIDGISSLHAQASRAAEIYER